MTHNPYDHHEDPHIEFGPHHEIHPELDHHFDHYHDIHPFEFHEHSVKPAFEYAS